MKKKFYLILLILMMTPGCCLFRGDPEISGQNIRLSEVTTDIEDTTMSINDLSTSIQEKADVAAVKAPDVKEIPEIKVDAGKISVLSNQTLVSVEKLKVLREEFDVKQEEAEKLKEENAKVKDKHAQDIRKMWVTVASIGALMFVGSVLVTIFYSHKLGFALMMASLLISVIATVMYTYMHIIVIVGGLFVLGLLVYMLYNAWADKKALSESVKSLEITKRQAWKDGARERVQQLQSPITKQRVSKVKEELDANGYFAVPQK